MTCWHNSHVSKTLIRVEKCVFDRERIRAGGGKRHTCYREAQEGRAERYVVAYYMMISILEYSLLYPYYLLPEPTVKHMKPCPKRTVFCSL